MSTKGWTDAEHEGGMGLAEIAAQLGVTKQRVQQIETVALRKLRKAAEAKGLRLEDFLEERRNEPCP